MIDEALRLGALEALGPLGDPIAREALELGRVERERAAATWEGSHGTVRADRVVLVLSPSLHARVTESPAANDGLTAAFAVAVAAADPRVTLYDLRLRPGEVLPASPDGPYR